jgi:hypothetical protein
VLLQHAEFDQGKGLAVHVRTTITDMYSFIEAVAVQLGGTSLEFYPDHFILHGNKVGLEDLPLSFGDGLEYVLKEDPKNKKNVIIELNKQASISIQSHGKFMHVSFSGTAQEYGNSVGILGDFSTGAMLGRNGQVMEDVLEYGFEWQVNHEDKVIFSEVRQPQLPFEKCRLPTQSLQARRRLNSAKNSALAAEAEAACNGLLDFELCISDILMTGDLGMVEAFQ